MPDKKRTVKLPRYLVEELETRVEKLPQEDVSGYITYILEELLADADELDLEAIDQEEVQQRLEALGYK